LIKRGTIKKMMALSTPKLLHLVPPSKSIKTTATRCISSASLTASLLPPSERISSNPSKMPPKKELAFGRVFSDHMLTVEYLDGKWMDPKIGRIEDLKISPAASSLHYG
jgi:hypothetical protein